jgi:hypothetical protein
MNRLKWLILWFSLIGIMGCGRKEPAVQIPELKTFQALVLTSDANLLVSPDKDSEEYKSSDQISVGMKDTTIYNKDGEKMELKEIQAGEIIEIAYNGIIMESYPAQITADRVEVKETRLMDGYQAVIEDIFKEDEGLNSDLEMVVIDTSALEELSGLEKEKLLGNLKNIFGLEVREGTYDQLVKEGIIDDKELYFDKGILIKITEPSHNNQISEITCGISKWKSGLGAIGSDHVTASLKKTGWIIEKKEVWKS